MPGDGASGGYRVIRGGRLLDIGARAARPADLLIAGDTIREIGPWGMPVPEGAAVQDATDRLLMPGLINGHTHAHGALAKGLVGDRWPLELLLNALPGFNRERTLADKYLCGLLNAVEMIRKGCTACFDMFVEFPLPSVEGIGAIGKAYADVGMRAVVAPMMADRTLYRALPGLLEAIPDPLRAEVEKISTAPYEASLEVCRRLLHQWPFDRDRIRPALAPTIPLHCSDEFLVGCRDLATEYEVCLQTHLAESKVQAVLGVRRYGKSLTAHLDGLGFLGPRLSAAHAIWLDAEDIRRFADRGASVVHNPLSNLRFGSGIAPVRELLERGVNVGIGTDATSTADTLNMFEATRLTTFLSRVATFDYPRWLGPDEVLCMATEGSARALGFGDVVGRLEPGCKADIVFLDLAYIHYVPLHDIVRQVVFAENGAAIAGVMVGGRMVFDGKTVLTIDERKLRADASEAAERHQMATAEARRFAAKLEDYVGAFCATQARLPHPVARHLGCLDT